MNIKQQQSQMLSDIFSLESIQSNRTNDTGKTSTLGLSIYQHSLLANASRALAITFATVHSFIGEAAFTQLVKIYLQKQLKTQFDWGDFGDNFASFLQHHTSKNSDILAAIAALDFACHHTERAEDVEKNLETLSLLNDVDAYQLSINFSAGFQVLKLEYPVDVIVTDISNAHQNSNSELSIIDIAEQLNRYKKSQFYFLIWRPNFQAQYKQITLQEYQWLALWYSAIANKVIKGTTTNQQLSIGAALDNVTHEAFSIIDWLPEAIEQQLIHSISTLVPD